MPRFSRAGEAMRQVRPVCPARPARPVRPIRPARPVRPVRPPRPVRPARPVRPMCPLRLLRTVGPAYPRHPPGCRSDDALYAVRSEATSGGCGNKLAASGISGKHGHGPEGEAPVIPIAVRHPLQDRDPVVAHGVGQARVRMQINASRRFAASGSWRRFRSGRVRFSRLRTRCQRARFTTFLAGWSCRSRFVSSTSTRSIASRPYLATTWNRSRTIPVRGGRRARSQLATVGQSPFR
jgi:hypothetical protein